METRLLRNVLLIIFLTGNILSMLAQGWTNIGFSGSTIEYLAVDKNNRLIVGGFQRARTSTDGGASWDSLFDNGRTYQKIIITDSNYIACNFWHSMGSQAGVYMSRLPDGSFVGGTGRIMGLNNGFFVNKRHNFFKSTNSGGAYTVSRTVDYGLNFTVVFSATDISNDAGSGLVENKANGTMLLFFTTNAPSPDYVDSTKIFRSSDNGANWTLAYLIPQVGYLKGMVCSSTGVFYAFFQDITTAHVLKSVDDGLSWTSSTITTTELNNFDGGKYICAPNGTLHYFNTSPDKSYVMSSSDEGVSWTKTIVPNTVSTAFIEDIVADNNSVLFLGTNNGLYKYSAGSSVDDGKAGRGTLKVVPNPSTGMITIEPQNINPVTDLEVYNMTGVKVFKQDRLGKIDLSGSPKGIYFVKVSDGVKTYGQRVIIQ